MFALRKAARFQNGLFLKFWVFKTLQLFCMFSSWSLYLMKSMQGGQPVLVKACSTVTPAQPALNPSITFLTWTTRSQSKGRLKSMRPFWKPVCEHLIYFCSTPRLYITKKKKFLIRTDHNHQIKCDIPSTTSENEAVVVFPAQKCNDVKRFAVCRVDHFWPYVVFSWFPRLDREL